MTDVGRSDLFDGDPLKADAEAAINLAYASDFEYQCIKSRVMGGVARRRAFTKFVQDYKASSAPAELIHPSLWAYGLEASA